METNEGGLSEPRSQSEFVILERSLYRISRRQSTEEGGHVRQKKIACLYPM